MPEVPLEYFRNRPIEKGKVYYMFTEEELEDLFEDIESEAISDERIKNISSSNLTKFSLDELLDSPSNPS